MAVPIRHKDSSDVADLINRRFNKDPNRPIVQEDFGLSPPPRLANIADGVNMSYNQNQLSSVVPRYPVPSYYRQPLQTSDVADIINSKFNRNPLKTASDFEMPARVVGVKQYSGSMYYIDPAPISMASQVQTLLPFQTISYPQPAVHGLMGNLNVPASTFTVSAPLSIYAGSASFVGLNQVDT
jgi:hypothetical protein